MIRRIVYIGLRLQAFITSHTESDLMPRHNFTNTILITTPFKLFKSCTLFTHSISISIREISQQLQFIFDSLTYRSPIKSINHSKKKVLILCIRIINNTVNGLLSFFAFCFDISFSLFSIKADLKCY